MKLLRYYIWNEKFSNNLVIILLVMFLNSYCFIHMNLPPFLTIYRRKDTIFYYIVSFCCLFDILLIPKSKMLKNIQMNVLNNNVKDILLIIASISKINNEMLHIKIKTDDIICFIKLFNLIVFSPF